jgi:hypothetical protein
VTAATAASPTPTPAEDAAAPAKAPATDTAAATPEAIVPAATTGNAAQASAAAPASVAATPAPAAATPVAAAAPAAAEKPVPLPAPAQRSAALAAPSGDRPQARTNEPPRSSGQTARQPSPLGTVGPSTWPSAFEDVIGFTLWPRDYGARLRAHGIGDVLGTIFSPSSARGRAGAAQARAEEPGKVADVGASGACAGPAQAPDWPSAEIERSMQLNATQRRALEQLKSSLGEAAASIRSTCRDDAALSPVERLRTMQNTLWAVHDAALLVRAPLAQFYDNLSDDQKRVFAPSPQADPRAMSRGEIARMCGSPTSNETAARNIEQALHATEAQRASLGTLQKKSFEMAQFLMASCLKPMPATPAERLDSAADRLTAVIFAASTVGLALNDLYNQLSDEQKTKFVAFGH